MNIFSSSLGLYIYDRNLNTDNLANKQFYEISRPHADNRLLELFIIKKNIEKMQIIVHDIGNLLVIVIHAQLVEHTSSSNL